MERPAEVKVGPWVYNIRWLSDKRWAKEGEREDWGGMSGHEETVIKIRLTEGRSEGSLRETLLHEINHCVWTAVALNHFPKAPKGVQQDEYVISSTTPTLLAVLRDNPKVLEYLTGP